MPVNTKQLRRHLDAARRDRNPQRFYDDIEESLADGSLKPDDFSIRQLFESFVEDGHGEPCGRELAESFNPRYASRDLLEDVSAVSTSAFSNITGQIAYSEIMQAFMAPAFVFTPLVRTVPTNLSGEKIAGVSQLGDTGMIVNEGEPYPVSGVHEDWIRTPETVKRGTVVPVTKEAIFFDRTGVVLDRCREVGTSLGLNKEKRIIDAVIDENATAHRFNWKNTVYATYQASSPWINVKTSNGLVDYTDVEAAELLFADMTDPWTGEPIMVDPVDLICTPQLKYTAMRIVNATEITVVTPGYQTSGNATSTKAVNPVKNYRILSSALLKARLATDTSWMIGDIGQAVRYMENWALTVTQAPPNSQAEFERDIVAQFKASERGAAVVVQPRALVQSQQ